jgi:hypothetical protein
MFKARGNIALLANLLGNGVAILGLAQSEPWLAAIGIAGSAASAATVLASKTGADGNRTPQPEIGNLHLDSLHLANLRRRLNKSLAVERAFQVAIIDGPDLHLAWQYDGCCRSQGEGTIEFSVDSENNVPFEQLECFAFDLQNDPARLHAVRPTLVGSDGVSKKVSVSFLKPLQPGDRFSVLLNCTLPGCVSTGHQYYTSSQSFAQESVESSSVHLIFVRARPDWVRVYEFDRKGRAVLVSELRPFRDDGATCEYVDMAQNAPGQSVRVYLYNLPALGTRTEEVPPAFAGALFSRN